MINEAIQRDSYHIFVWQLSKKNHFVNR